MAGQGNSFFELDSGLVKEVVAVTQNDFRNWFRRQFDKARGLRVIEGSVGVGGTWSEAGLGKSRYDVVVCRPEQPIYSFDSVPVGFLLLDRMYRMLAEEGVLLTQLPSEVIFKTGTDWIEKLARTDGLYVRYDGNFLPQLLLVRLPRAPEDLSFLKRVKLNPSSRRDRISSRGPTSRYDF